MNWVAAGVVVAAIVALGAFLRWQMEVLFDAKLGLFRKELDMTYVRKDVFEALEAGAPHVRVRRA